MDRITSESKDPYFTGEEGSGGGTKLKGQEQEGGEWGPEWDKSSPVHQKGTKGMAKGMLVTTTGEGGGEGKAGGIDRSALRAA